MNQNFLIIQFLSNPLYKTQTSIKFYHFFFVFSKEFINSSWELMEKPQHLGNNSHFLCDYEYNQDNGIVGTFQEKNRIIISF